MASGRAIFVFVLVLVGIGLMAGIFLVKPSGVDEVMPTGKFYGEKINISFSDQQNCVSDSECVPVPGCHAKECINQGYTYMHKKDMICNTLREKGAAYTSEDCGCVNNKCVNKNSQ